MKSEVIVAEMRRELIVAEMRRKGWDLPSISKQTGLSYETVRSYVSRAGLARVRKTYTKRPVAGRRTVTFTGKAGQEVTRTWETKEERLSVIREMAACGLTHRAIAETLGVSPATMKTVCCKAGIRLIDLRPLRADRQVAWLSQSSRLLVEGYAKKSGLRLTTAIDVLVTAGFKAVSEKRADND